MSRKWILIIAAVIVAIFIRVFLILSTFAAADEIWSIFLLNNSYSDIWNGAFADYNGPFHFLLIKTIQIVFHIPSSLPLLRWTSFIFGCLVSFGVYQLSLLLTNKKTAFLIFLLSLFLPSFIWLSVFGRYYALLNCFSIVNIYSFVKLLSSNNKKFILSFFIASLLGIYTHYYFAFLLIAQFIFLIFFQNKNKKLLLVVFVAIFVCSFPLFFSFLNAPGWSIVSIRNSIFKIPAVFVTQLISFQSIIYIQFIKSMYLLIIFGLFFLLQILLMVLGKDRWIRFYLCIICIPIILLTIASVIKPIFAVNSFLIFLPIYTIVLANGLTYIYKKKLYIAILFSIFTAFSLLIFIDSFRLNYYFAQPFLFVQKKVLVTDVVLHSDIYTYVGGYYYLPHITHYALNKSVTNPISEKTHSYKIISIPQLKSEKRFWYFDPHFYNSNETKKSRELIEKDYQSILYQRFKDSDINVYLFNRK